MRDFQSIRRSLLRRSGLYSHKSSYPFISGDTFRSFCSIRFDSLKDFERLNQIYGYKGKVFVSAGIAQEFFCKLDARSATDLSSIDLVIHNGDIIPDFRVFQDWNAFFSSIASVNWLGALENVRALPIGLENWSYMQNGVPSDFKSNFQLTKKINLLVCFNDRTNPFERSAARAAAKPLNGVHFVSSQSTPENYRRLVRQSRFVLSPPGNGPDCHRTWEALYLGSVPVVKKKYWAFTDLGLPVIELDEWEDLGDILENQSKFSRLDYFDLQEIFLKEFLNEN